MGAQSPVSSAGSRGVWPQCTLADGGFPYSYPHREAIGGGFVLCPCIITQAQPIPRVYGELDGVFWVPGFGTAAEDTLDYNGTTHVILQNAHRNSATEFWALALE